MSLWLSVPSVLRFRRVVKKTVPVLGAICLWSCVVAAGPMAGTATPCDVSAYCSITLGDLLGGGHDQASIRPLPLVNGVEKFLALSTRQTRPGYESVSEIWLEQYACAPFDPSPDVRRQKLLADPAGAISYLDPAWSPDGKYLAYVETDALVSSSRILIQEFQVDEHILQAVIPVGPPIVAVAAGPGTRARHPAWRPDGLELAFDSNASGLSTDLYTIDVNPAAPPPDPPAPVRRTTNDSRVESRPAYSPDGRYLAYETNRFGPFVIEILDLTTSAVTLLDPLTALINHGNPAWSSDGRIVFYDAPQGEDPSTGLSRLWAYDRVTQSKQEIDVAPAFRSDSDVDVSRYSSVAGGLLFNYLAFTSLDGPSGTNLWRGAYCLGATVSEARAFTLAPDKTIRLDSAKPTWCVEVEPIAASFDLTDVELTSVVLSSAGTGTVGAIPARVEETVVMGDQDRNGIAEMRFCFAKNDLRQLFSSLAGRNDVPVVCEGSLTGGGKFSATLVADVVAGEGEPLSVTAAPNPANPEARITARLARPGPVRVRLFTPDGRLVRTILDLPNAAAGDLAIRIDGRDQRGARLASGIYLYRVELRGESITGRISIMR
jgi:hypothetical protein